MMDLIDAFWNEITRTEITLPNASFRLALSLLLGGIVGFERKRRGQIAGSRTFALISMGATLAMIVSIYIPQAYFDLKNGDPGRIAAQVITGKSVELFRWLKYTVFSGCFFTMIFTRISLSFSMDANCASGMVPPLYNSTQVSSARNMVSTSENPNLPKILPPTVAQFRNCTPTMCRTLSRMAPFV